MRSAWHHAIRVSLGKLTIKKPIDKFINAEVAVNRFALLPIGLNHMRALASLPLHHRDPFDRMLVAQALSEGVPIISRDPALDPYGVKRVW